MNVDFELYARSCSCDLQKPCSLTSVGLLQSQFALYNFEPKNLQNFTCVKKYEDCKTEIKSHRPIKDSCLRETICCLTKRFIGDKLFSTARSTFSSASVQQTSQKTTERRKIRRKLTTMKKNVARCHEIRSRDLRSVGKSSLAAPYSN